MHLMMLVISSEADSEADVMLCTAERVPIPQHQDAIQNLRLNGQVF
jgi:hypothetical protein